MIKNPVILIKIGGILTSCLRAVKIFTDNLLHENILVRKASLHVIESVLKQHKRKHIKLRMSELPEINRMESNKENLQSISSVDSARENSKLECDSNGQDDFKSEGELRTLTGLKVRPGEREDNKWLQYSADNKPLDQVNKIHSFIHQPRTMPMNAHLSRFRMTSRDISTRPILDSTRGRMSR